MWWKLRMPSFCRAFPGPRWWGFTARRWRMTGSSLAGFPYRWRVCATCSRFWNSCCVRVVDPPALARHVLRNNPEWTAERIHAAMHAETGTRITLAQPIRVFLIYATALALEDGRVLFFEDIYHHDEKLEKVW